MVRVTFDSDDSVNTVRFAHLGAGGRFGSYKWNSFQQNEAVIGRSHCDGSSTRKNKRKRPAARPKERPTESPQARPQLKRPAAAVPAESPLATIEEHPDYRDIENAFSLLVGNQALILLMTPPEMDPTQ